MNWRVPHEAAQEAANEAGWRAADQAAQVKGGSGNMHDF
jgi:hypothetical protein